MKSLLALVLPEGDLEQISKELMFFRHYCSENIGMCNKEVSSWFFFFFFHVNQAGGRTFQKCHVDFFDPRSNVFHTQAHGFANTCVVF